jgi:hypothetical protein
LYGLELPSETGMMHSTLELHSKIKLKEIRCNYKLK